MNQSTIITNKKKYNSYFDKKVKDYVFLQIKTLILGVITLGLAYPWIVCMKEKAKAKHTVICGKRMKFIGDPKELVWHWIIWWFLIVITLGIYKIFVNVRFERWVTANTVFDDTEII